MTPGKTIALTRRTFVGKVMLLLFRHCLGLSQLSSEEQGSFNFMASHHQQWFWSPRKLSLSMFPWFPHLLTMIFIFWISIRTNWNQSNWLEPVSCSLSGSNCCFLICIQVSQEAGKVIRYSHLFKNFPQFVVIHTVKGFGLVNKAETDFFWNSLAFWWSNRCWQFDLWFLCLF